MIDDHNVADQGELATLLRPAQEELDRLFGSSLSQVRNGKPRVVPSHGRATHMTQQDLADRFSADWNAATGENRRVDAAWIRKVERGKVHIDYTHACCLATAVGATGEEKTFLLAAAGFDGLATVLLEEYGIQPEALRVEIAYSICQVNKGEMTLAETLEIIRVQRKAVRVQLMRKLQQEDH